nr:glycosyltransferase [Nitratireductor aquibiodomus]
MARLAQRLFATPRQFSFFLGEHQSSEYRRAFHLGEERYRILSPVIHVVRAEELRKIALEPKPENGDRLGLLSIATAAENKGVDLSIRAVARCPDAQLTVIGLKSKDAKRMRSLAQSLNCDARVEIVAYGNVLAQLQNADLLLHPARLENTGTVIVEALLAGVPAIATENCGYAKFLRDGAGIVLPQQPTIDQILEALEKGREAKHLLHMRQCSLKKGGELAEIKGAWLNEVVKSLSDYDRCKADLWTARVFVAMASTESCSST